MSRIYWDTMLFIYWLEANPAYEERVDAIWSRMQKRNDELITGALALGEILAGAYKHGADRKQIEKVRAGFEGAVSEVIPFSEKTADLFGQIKGSLKIPSADAIHLACAASAGTDLFFTNDDRLLGKIVPGIQFIASLNHPML